MNKIFTFLFSLLALSLSAQTFNSFPKTLISDSEVIDFESYYEALDFDGDGDLDIVAGWPTTLYTNENGDYTTTEVALGKFRATGDFNGDGNIDVLTPTGIIMNDGNGNFEFSVSSVFGVRYVADFDNDGNDDYLNWEEDPNGVVTPDVSLVMSNGDGTFANPELLTSNINHSVTIGDFNGDDFTDIAIVEEGSLLTIRTNNGDATFTYAELEIVGGRRYISSGDIDSDGDMDLVWGATAGRIEVAYNENGTFTSAETLIETGEQNIRGILLSDFSGDDILDIVALPANSFSMKTNYYLNDGVGEFNEPVELFDDGSFPNSEFNYKHLASADVDGDGDNDIMVHYPNSTISWFENKLISSVVTLTPNANFSIFPNPFAESIRVEAEALIGENVLVQLTDVTGKLVLSQKGQLPMNVKLTSEVTQGNYILTVHSQKTSALLATGKLTK